FTQLPADPWKNHACSQMAAEHTSVGTSPLSVTTAAEDARSFKGLAERALAHYLDAGGGAGRLPWGGLAYQSCQQGLFMFSRCRIPWLVSLAVFIALSLA